MRLLALPITVAALTTACMSTVTGQASAPTGERGERGEALAVFEQVQPPEVGSCLDTVRGGTGPLGPPATLSCSQPHGVEIAKVVDVPVAWAATIRPTTT